MSIIAKIAARAKQIRKKQPGKSWQACIKAASKELKGTTVSGVKTKKKKAAPAKVKKIDYRQTGSSVKFYDEARKAYKPGKRKSAGGSIYYERRKNRSDKPGSLTGLPQVKVTHRIANEVAEKYKALEQIKTLRGMLKGAQPGDKVAIRGSIAYYLKAARAAKQNITNLKKLI